MGWKDDAAVPLSPENADKILEMLEGGSRQSAHRESGERKAG